MSIRKLAGARKYIPYRPRKSKSESCGSFSSITNEEQGPQPRDIKIILHGIRQAKHALFCLWSLSGWFFSAHKKTGLGAEGEEKAR